MQRTNEKKKNIKWHEICKCECRLDAIVCNNKQRWNNDICRCKYKELINKGVCNKGYAWNPSNFECDCYKSCDIVSIQIIKIVNVKKGWWIKQLANVIKLLIR